MSLNMLRRVRVALFFCFVPMCAFADRGAFDLGRWDDILANVRARAAAQNISRATIDAALKYPAFIPAIIKSDANQSEFKLTMDEYLARMVNETRVQNGRKMRTTYPTMLGRVEKRYGVPPHVILAFWGMESNYGALKARHKLSDAFLTLMYDGRRETFFGNQLLALMKIADKNNLDINDIHGSWAGAMGHFQFIPTTLAQYGVDGNGDGRVDIIGSVGDAMHSAGNYLNKLGWNRNERIVRRVMLPADFDVSLLDGSTRKTLVEWSAMGVTNPDGTPVPHSEMLAGLVADVNSINAARAAHAAAVAEAEAARLAAGAAQSPQNAAAQYGNTDFYVDTDVPPMPAITAYLTYPNFYRIKKWNNSNWYAIAIGELAERLK